MNCACQKPHSETCKKNKNKQTTKRDSSRASAAVPAPKPERQKRPTQNHLYIYFSGEEVVRSEEHERENPEQMKRRGKTTLSRLQPFFLFFFGRVDVSSGTCGDTQAANLQRKTPRLKKSARRQKLKAQAENVLCCVSSAPDRPEDRRQNWDVSIRRRSFQLAAKGEVTPTRRGANRAESCWSLSKNRMSRDAKTGFCAFLSTR